MSFYCRLVSGRSYPSARFRPSVQNAKAPSTLPARTSYDLRHLRLRQRTLRSLGCPFRFSFTVAAQPLPVVVVTNCPRSSAMSCELNQSAECPDAPDAGKRYTGPESGQRHF
jgi:hypothetical protein